MHDDARKPRPFRWTAKRARAAVLIAEDSLNDGEIAKALEVAPSTVYRWRQAPDFAGKVGAHIGALQAGMLRLAIAKKHRRLATLDRLHSAALAVIEHRAARYRAQLGEADAETAAATAAKRVFGHDVPAEAGTGLVVERESVNSAGYRAVEWSVDVGLMREIRALEAQAARELGQWVDPGAGAFTTRIEIVGVDADLL